MSYNPYDDTWLPKDGQPIKICKLEDGHLLNIHRWLLRQRGNLTQALLQADLTWAEYTSRYADKDWFDNPSLPCEEDLAADLEEAIVRMNKEIKRRKLQKVLGLIPLLHG